MAHTRRWDRFCEEMRPVLSTRANLAREEPLAPKTTMRVGGAARLYAEPATEEDLRLRGPGGVSRGAGEWGAKTQRLGLGAGRCMISGALDFPTKFMESGFEPAPPESMAI